MRPIWEIGLSVFQRLHLNHIVTKLSGSANRRPIVVCFSVLDLHNMLGGKYLKKIEHLSFNIWYVTSQFQLSSTHTPPPICQLPSLTIFYPPIRLLHLLHTAQQPRINGNVDHVIKAFHYNAFPTIFLSLKSYIFYRLKLIIWIVIFGPFWAFINPFDQNEVNIDLSDIVVQSLKPSSGIWMPLLCGCHLTSHFPIGNSVGASLGKQFWDNVSYRESI